MDGILILSYYHLSLESGLSRANAMLQTCRTQLRPVMMTCILACVGLLPAAFSTGIGSQVQRPLALVVVGGMLLAPLLILHVLPVLILKFSRAQQLPRELPRESDARGARGLGAPLWDSAPVWVRTFIGRRRRAWTA